MRREGGDRLARFGVRSKSGRRHDLELHRLAIDTGVADAGPRELLGDVAAGHDLLPNAPRQLVAAVRPFAAVARRRFEEQPAPFAPEHIAGLLGHHQRAGMPDFRTERTRIGHAPGAQQRFVAELRQHTLVRIQRMGTRIRREHDMASHVGIPQHGMSWLGQREVGEAVVHEIDRRAAAPQAMVTQIELGRIGHHRTQATRAEEMLEQAEFGGEVLRVRIGVDDGDARQRRIPALPSPLNTLARIAQGDTSRCRKQQAKIDTASCDRAGDLVAQLDLARKDAARSQALARDVRTLAQWLGHDVLSLAGPNVGARPELYDFIAVEIQLREHQDVRRIRPMWVALQNQRDDLLAFAGVLDGKLAAIAKAHDVSEHLVRQACLLHRKPSSSTAYWKRWNRLRSRLTDKFHLVFDAVARAMAGTPRCSSLVENLNSRLRTYFTLRRHLGGSYLALLQFFLTHRRFRRSRADRKGKSPRELMTGQEHPHWFTLLGLGEPQCCLT